MIYECTDCKHCADFSSGFRLFCAYPEAIGDEVLEFYPLGEKDAKWNCSWFDDTAQVHMFSFKKFVEAEGYSQELFGEVSYEGIRKYLRDKHGF